MRVPWLLLLPAVLVPVLLATAGPLRAQQEIATRPARVALFKNGFAFVLRYGDLPEETGLVQLTPLPAAAHGTMWLSWNPAVSLTDLVAERVMVDEYRDALSIPELLQANVGKRMRLEFASELLPPLEGVLESYPSPETPEAPNPYLSSAPVRIREGEMLLFRTDQGLVALSPRSVQRVVFLEDPARQVPLQRPVIRFAAELTRTAPSQQLTVSYLTKGLTWAPSYLVDISEPNRAVLTAKAEIINEVEDLARVDVDLITGFPNLQFADVISPLARKEDLAGFLRALASGSSETRARREWAGALSQVTSNYPGVAGFAGESDAAPLTPDYGAAQAGVAAEDLFLYPLTGVTLAQDAVGYYPLFTGQVPYEHVYEWELPDYVSDERFRPPSAQQPETVWHSLRLTNGLNAPWTTAPATIVQSGRLLGQSMVKYTPAGAQTMLRLTQALDVQAQQSEAETDRELDAFRTSYAVFDRVTVTGRLRLFNHKPQPVPMEVTKLLSGTLQSSDPQAEVVHLVPGVQEHNPRARITWKLTLAPSSTQEIHYVYQVLIRR